MKNTSSPITPHHQQEGGAPVPLSFVYDEPSGSLTALIRHGQVPYTPDLPTVKEQIKKQGFDKISLSDTVLQELLSHIHNNKDYACVLCGTPKHTQIQLTKHPKNQQLIAQLVPAGKAIKYRIEDINNRIAEEGYAHYQLNHTAIEAVIHNSQNNRYGEYVIGKHVPFTHINFKLNDATGELFAELSATDKEHAPVMPWIEEKLKAEKLDRLYFDSNELNKLPQKVKNNEHGVFLIGQRKDASVLITCDDNFMHAYITVLPPYGGREFNSDILKASLKKFDINEACCDKKILDNILNKKIANNVLFASGYDKQEGKETYFEALVTEVEHIPLEENKTKAIDDHSALHFAQVNVGIPLMQRHPAIPGTHGKNVKGQIIPASTIHDVSFNKNLTGVKASPDNPNILISDIKGHPVILADGACVDDIMMVNNVDMSTGNINYDGSVMVKGEVMPGMKIQATGDIIACGVVNRAVLQAQNNITVHCGVIGDHVNSEKTKEEKNLFLTRLKAGGDITIQYASQAKLIAAHDITVHEYISHCYCEAKGTIQVGQTGGKGRIFGGEYHAYMSINANHIGAESELKTQVSAGITSKIYHQFYQLKQALERRANQKDTLSTLLTSSVNQFEATPLDTGLEKKIQYVKKLLKKTQIEISKINTAISNLNHDMIKAKNAHITIKEGVYTNVNISINGCDFHVKKESKGGKFSKKGNSIHWST